MYTDWVQDKINAKFTLPGMCWSLSFIPKAIWQVGDSTSNIIESLHSDVNKEGVAFTLVGGMRKGQCFDQMKFQTLQVSLFIQIQQDPLTCGPLKAAEEVGVRLSYRTGHLSENTLRGVKRDSMWPSSF